MSSSRQARELPLDLKNGTGLPALLVTRIQSPSNGEQAGKGAPSRRRRARDLRLHMTVCGVGLQSSGAGFLAARQFVVY